ncbi:MAG: DUF1800 family protein [Coraliomargaritaceae bacterium]
MLRAYLISYPVLVFFWSVLASWGGLIVYDEINFSNDEVAIDLSDSIHPIEVLEYSDGLSEWVPVSRNYGNGWETIFPYSYSLESGILSIPKGNEGFLRKRYESSEQNYSALELVSEFLMQATFGPNLNSIVTFPNVFDPNFHNNQYVNFEIWIDEQISKTPFSHRAYWRQRSDPAFTDASSQTGYLENEVGHDASLGQRLPFYRGTVKYATDHTNPLPGYGGLFCVAEEFTDTPNGTYDEGEEFTDTNGNGVYNEGEVFVDTIGNGVWDAAEGFTTSAEEFTDDNGNGIWDEGEGFTVEQDTNNNGVWDAKQDSNNNGIWDEGEEFTDTNGNGIWDNEEAYIDSHPNGSYDAEGAPILASLYSDNLVRNGIPMIGLHIENAIASTGKKWDVMGFNANDTEKLVWFEAAINAEDQLRQRVAWALSQYFVVGEPGSNHPNTTERYLNFYDIFVRKAFGNFRDILSEITWSPHMGYYLSYIENKKANSSQGTFPDENFAREVMQLFTIGLWELNEDGTLELDNEGNAIPTYDNNDIAEFAKVFTGLRRPFDRVNIEIFFGNYIDPMRIQSNRHDFSSKKLLDGTYLNFDPNNGLYDDWESFVDSNNNGIYDSGEEFADTTESVAVRYDVEGLLDHLFNHKNMPPFFAKFLIQRMTVSNPSPNYIFAVADAFKTGLYNGSGSGNRGDMTSTVKAVLLHPEAREKILSFDPSHGKLREPLIRLMHLSRAFNLTSLRTYDWIYFVGLEDTILQSPYESPTVFNYYRPDYSPNGSIGNIQLNAPEFQINNDVSALHLANAFNTLINHGIVGGDIGNIGSKPYVGAELDFSYEISLSHNDQLLLDHLDLILCGGKLNPDIKQTIADALVASNLSQLDRVRYAVSLFVLTIEFNTLF